MYLEGCIGNVRYEGLEVLLVPLEELLFCDGNGWMWQDAVERRSGKLAVHVGGRRSSHPDFTADSFPPSLEAP